MKPTRLVSGMFYVAIFTDRTATRHILMYLRQQINRPQKLVLKCHTAFIKHLASFIVKYILLKCPQNIPSKYKYNRNLFKYSYFLSFFLSFLLSFFLSLLVYSLPIHCWCRGLLLHPITLDDAHQVRLSWTSSQPEAETST